MTCLAVVPKGDGFAVCGGETHDVYVTDGASRTLLVLEFCESCGNARAPRKERE